MKYGVVNYPVKVIDEEIINALADIEIHHTRDMTADENAE